MSNNAPDYENDLAFEPKSADDLNEQGRESDVLVSALEKCEKLEKEVKQLRELLKQCIPAAEFARDFGLAAMIKSAIGESEEINNGKTN